MDNHINFILTKKGCPFCLEAKRAAAFINRYLPDEKQIYIKDNFEWEKWGFKSNAIVDRLDSKSFDGYPYIRIGNIELEPGSWELLVIAIAKILEDDLMMPLNMNNLIHIG